MAFITNGAFTRLAERAHKLEFGFTFLTFILINWHIILDSLKISLALLPLSSQAECPANSTPIVMLERSEASQGGGGKPYRWKHVPYLIGERESSPPQTVILAYARIQGRGQSVFASDPTPFYRLLVIFRLFEGP